MPTSNASNANSADMRILLTGGTGFVGGHAIRDLTGAGHEVALLTLPGETAPEGIPFREADIRDRAALDRIVGDLAPEAVLHLAGIAFVPFGWEHPVQTFDVNLNGTVHLLEAVRHHAPRARVLAVSSALIYGTRPRPDPIREEDPAEPESIYAASKLAADQTVRLYARKHGLAALTARPCNHIGPGQSPSFVVPSFARQLLDIRAGTADPTMWVGNLDSTREFLDVRDVVTAYRILLETGTPGEAYNISAERGVAIRTILDALCDAVGVHPAIEVDPDRYRPTDHQPILSSAKLRHHTGWEPVHDLNSTLQAVLAELGGHPPPA